MVMTYSTSRWGAKLGSYNLGIFEAIIIHYPTEFCKHVCELRYLSNACFIDKSIETWSLPKIIQLVNGKVKKQT